MSVIGLLRNVDLNIAVNMNGTMNLYRISAGFYENGGEDYNGAMDHGHEKGRFQRIGRTAGY